MISEGEDYNAKAMIQRNTEQIRQHNGYTGMEKKQPRRDWTELLQGTQNTETLDNRNCPTAIRRQSTRCSSQT